VLRTIFRLFREYKPFAFFGSLALAFLLFAVLCMIPVMHEFFATGMVPRFPPLIVGVSLGVCALLSFFSGLILEVSVKQRIQMTELLMNLYSEVKEDEVEK
jgi:uncharacterized membrane protein